MRFKYLYEHLDCTLCDDMSIYGCPHLLCLHIMSNLDDLRHNPAFITAVELAEHLPTPHNPKAGQPRLQPHFIKNYKAIEDGDFSWDAIINNKRIRNTEGSFPALNRVDEPGLCSGEIPVGDIALKNVYLREAY